MKAISMAMWLLKIGHEKCFGDHVVDENVSETTWLKKKVMKNVSEITWLMKKLMKNVSETTWLRKRDGEKCLVIMWSLRRGDHVVDEKCSRNHMVDEKK
jgi:hypothetical protein